MVSPLDVVGSVPYISFAHKYIFLFACDSVNILPMKRSPCVVHCCHNSCLIYFRLHTLCPYSHSFSGLAL